ncbi:SNAP receptor [Datura stramonium]|uniref:SNAP receptor n=1 Tax=Datura stramonium TaxID=4076 RepID=A0ABS8TL03_DATST|nr:SNAP receptor [Datura stramonium]
MASGIFQINTAVSMFQRLVNTLGTPKDTPELREKLHKTRLHIGQLVKDTSAKLKQASGNRSFELKSVLARKLQMLNLLKIFKLSKQQALLLESKRQEFVLLDNEISFNEAIIEEREQEYKSTTADRYQRKHILLQIFFWNVLVPSIENSHAATAEESTTPKLQRPKDQIHLW